MISHKQLEMLLDPQEAFDGASYDADRDYVRLSGQLNRVYRALLDQQWHTLRGLAFAAQCSEASASARLRDLRKFKFGAFTIERRHVTRGLHEYRIKRT